MVRTCNGLELRDPAMYAETSASELLDTSQGDLFLRDDFAPQELEAMALGGSCRIHGTPVLPPLCGDTSPFNGNGQEAPPFLGPVPHVFAMLKPWK